MGISYTPFPVRSTLSPPSPRSHHCTVCLAQLASYPPLDCPATPCPPLAAPVSPLSRYPCCPLSLPPLPLHRSPDLLVNPIETDPGHPSPRFSGEPNRPTAWLPAFPRRQRSPLQISDLVSIKLSRISSSYYSPFQAPRVPKDRATVSAPTPSPLLTKPASWYHTPNQNLVYES